MVQAHPNPVIEPKLPPWFSGLSSYAADFQSKLFSGRLDDPSIATLKDEDLADKVEADPVVAKALNIRVHQVAGRDTYLQCRSAAARKAKPFVNDIMAWCENFDEARLILAKGATLTGLRWAKMAGQFVYARMGSDTAPRSWWVPRWLVDIDKRDLRLEAKQEKWLDASGTSGKRWKYQWVIRSLDEQGGEEVVRHPEHFIRHQFHATENTLGNGRGLYNSLYWYAKAKSRAFEWLITGLERFGYPWIWAALAPGNIDAQIGQSFPTREARMDALLDAVKKMKRHQLLITAPEDKVQPLDLGGAGNVLILQVIQYLDKAMVELILGASMPSGGGEQGSFARAQVEAETTNTMIEYDRLVLGKALTRDFVSAIIRYNLGNFRAAGIPLPTAAALELKIGREVSNNYALNKLRLETLRAVGLPTRSEQWFDWMGAEMPEGVDIPDVVPGLSPDMAAAAAPTMVGGSEIDGAAQFRERIASGDIATVTDSTGMPIWRGRAA